MEGGVIAARYATTTFTVQVASGASELVLKGSQRDSAHPAVTAASGLFTSAAPVKGVDVDALMWNRLQAYPAGSEV